MKIKSRTLGLIAVPFLLAPVSIALAGDPPDHIPQLSGSRAVWSTPGDGRLVMVARNAAGFNAGVPLRVRFCVTNMTGTANSLNLYVWTSANPWDGVITVPPPKPPPVAPVPGPQTRHLDLGDCVELDRPAAIIVQDSTISGTSSGYYELLEQSKLQSATQSVVAPAQPSRKHASAISLENETLQPLACGKITPATSDNYYTKCPLVMKPNPKRHGVRICMSGDYATWKNPPQQIQYAASLIDFVIDPAYLPPLNKPQDYDYNWNPVTSNGCRDVFGTEIINIMIGPNVAGGYWDPSTVTKVALTTWDIEWAEANE